MSITGVDTEKKYVKMKQDVYEHLAKTFLDKKKKKKISKRTLRNFLLSVIIVFCLTVFYFLSSFISRKNIFEKSLYVIYDKTPVLIECDFILPGNSKTKALSLNLNKIDLNEYNFLGLSVRTGEKTKLDSTIKVQIENSLLEKDAEYISGINKKWSEFSLPLENFEMIKDWSSIKSITFEVEDWNVASKKIKIFIDDVRFVE